SAVLAAHELGIVHRDLKPSNLFRTLRWDGTICMKVLDFGLCKRFQGDTLDVAQALTDGTLGTPMYMSPEQLGRAWDVDDRADVWSLGVVLFRLLTGEYPFSEGSDLEIAAHVVRDAPRSLCSLCDAPPELETVVLRCLEKSRE